MLSDGRIVIRVVFPLRYWNDINAPTISLTTTDTYSVAVVLFVYNSTKF